MMMTVVRAHYSIQAADRHILNRPCTRDVNYNYLQKKKKCVFVCGLLKIWLLVDTLGFHLSAQTNLLCPIHPVS